MAGRSIDFALELAILSGTGAGMPLGVRNSPATIDVTAEAAQTSDTINQPNVAKMYSRLHAASFPSAVAVCHPDALAQLLVTTPSLVTPADDAAPCGRLMGLAPLVPHEGCEMLGDRGDLIIGSFGDYLLTTRTPDWVGSSSLHVFFDKDLQAFKFTFRASGQPWAAMAVASRVSNTTRSSFVQLAAR